MSREPIIVEGRETKTPERHIMTATHLLVFPGRVSVVVALGFDAEQIDHQLQSRFIQIHVQPIARNDVHESRRAQRQARLIARVTERNKEKEMMYMRAAVHRARLGSSQASLRRKGIKTFLDALSHLYKRVCLSVCLSVHQSVTHKLNF